MRDKLHPRLRDIVDNKNWKDFTDVQKEAFDPIYDGEHCIIEAPTAGGKTEAVFFPLLTRIAADKSSGVKALYIAPLKALLNDVELRVAAYAKACYLEAFKWHGDVSQSSKIQQMLLPSEVLLTTPESLEAILLRKGNWNEWFHNLQTIVVDEAHNFAMSDRGSHLISLLERLENEIEATPQRIAVTATIGNPDELMSWLLGKRNTNGRQIVVKNKVEKQKNFKLQFLEGRTEDESLVPGIDAILYNLIAGKKSIVFAHSRSGTEDIAKHINERNSDSKTRMPVKVRTHHSSVSKYLREDAECLIKARSESRLNAIISTSTLELGIDIGELDQVIQIGELSSSGSFLQRVGRTGRRPEKAQFFRGICDQDEHLILMAACISLGLKSQSESILFSKQAFHILAHQIICLCLQKMGITKTDIWKILSRSYCFSKVSQTQFDELVSHMIQQDFLRQTEQGLLLTSDKTEKTFLRANWKRLFAVFDSGPVYNVVDGKKIVGTLDSNFAKMQKVPFLFMLGGIEWRATKLNHETQQIAAQKTKTGNIPKWKVFSTDDVPFETAQEVGKILTGNQLLPFLDEAAAKSIERQREHYKFSSWNPGAWSFNRLGGGKIQIFTFAGSKINRTLASILNASDLGNAEYDYRTVEIKLNPEASMTDNKFGSGIAELRNGSTQQVINSIQQSIRNTWFSKFSICLPENLSKTALIERAMDIDGLKRELPLAVEKLLLPSTLFNQMVSKKA
ncbi:MAG: DEAD/DEAH box helicase [Agriterribacter sp.]